MTGLEDWSTCRLLGVDGISVEKVVTYMSWGLRTGVHVGDWAWMVYQLNR